MDQDRLVRQAQAGDLDAFSSLVRRYQDIAVGYAYSILQDFHLAEDAAQEAFIEACRIIGQLRTPAAFASWFRRIVFKHCDRIIRRKRPATAPLYEAAYATDDATDPLAELTVRE
jgi:RNA polymerase sigma factor (sigma-70 family)